MPPGYDRHRSPSSLHYGSNAMNQVYIFSSQPLSSPSRTPISGSLSLQNSPMERLLALRMSALSVNKTIEITPIPLPAFGSSLPVPSPCLSVPGTQSRSPLPPVGLEVGSGSATTATAKALATATMMSCSPSGVSAAELMVNARAGTSSNAFLQPTPNLPLVEAGDEDEEDSPHEDDVDVDVASFVSASTQVTTPATSFAPSKMKIVQDDGMESGIGWDGGEMS